MAKRLLRDWTASTRIDAISPEAEVFFTRLIMKADDYGSFHANPKLLKAALFPLKEEVTMQQIGAWVFECTEAGLLFPYEAEGKEFIRIVDFGQRMRQKKSAFPHPDNSPQVAADGGELRVEEKRREIEIEIEGNSESISVKKNVPHGRFEIDSYPNGKAAFEEIQNDDQMVERLLRVVRNEGYAACTEVTVMKAVKRFIAAEEAKPDFTNRPRDDLKKHLVNWIRTKAKTLQPNGT